MSEMKQSFWCWLRRHRMLIAGYDYSDGHDVLPRIVWACQCKIASTDVPTFIQQLRRKK